ncbi:alkylation response protein AidB-like acyl-CoA dehydrogenase [Paucibacter oligotrophus]|uniref:Alkylation response protein AidB-like acyl-CoA dehydrogenase n=1 Tax=Roseateles oligotrophus TaxID=1769250 RepID=A0A840L1P8_9BURK|nr:acyl-CoA dehydrogenase family protein [Roseateles oligotrophus]MBB4841816.1 alkylation response protein AidB-like acyl-CoA dehydrogenase [Roseateles oligotrophus]
MDFDFNEDQQSLREAVRRWVEKDYSFERRQAIVRGGGFSREAWDGLLGLGLGGLRVAEAHGGLGLGAVDAMVVMEELGRGLVMEPFAQAALIAPLLLQQASAEIQASCLPRIAGGEALIVLAQQERGARYRLTQVSTRVHEGKLTGHKSLVPAGDVADAFIVPARISGADSDDQGIALYLVERKTPGVSTRAYSLQDGSRAAELSLNAASASLLAGPEQGLALLELAQDIGIAALCAEGVGAMEKLLCITADYLNTRKQFGVAIGSFQALRHRMADVKMQLELARSMSYYASLKLGEAAASRRLALSQAKLQLCNSLRYVGQQCTQLHGGIGVTDEYIGSHYFKRLTVMSLQFGDDLHHLDQVSRRMQDTAGVFS